MYLLLTLYRLCKTGNVSFGDEVTCVSNPPIGLQSMLYAIYMYACAWKFNLPDINSTGCQYPHHVNEAFLKLISENNFEQKVDFPTRKDNTLDPILTSYPGDRQRCKPIPSMGNSDHAIVFYDTTLAPHRPKDTRRNILLWKKANIQGIKDDTVNNN